MDDERRVLGALRRCRAASIATLAAELGVTEEGVARALAAAKRRGIVRSKRRASGRVVWLWGKA